MRLNFELVNYDLVVQYVSNYITIKLENYRVATKNIISPTKKQKD